MISRHNLIPWLLLLFLAACSGGAGGPGADGSGPMGGPVGGSGNYAAGPVSLPTPGTLNKNLIVCENIAGPKVECRGSAGSVPPNAEIRISVHAAGFSRFQIQSLFFGTAYAAGDSIVVTSDGTGAFKGEVEAVKDEVIQIQVGSARLLLTVPEELGSVSGSTGTMKNMTLDGDGNLWFSRGPSPAPGKKWSWSSLFFSEAQAAPSTSVPQDSVTELGARKIAPEHFQINAASLGVPTGGSLCSGETVDTASEIAADAAIANRCELRRMGPSSETPEVAATFPGCNQEDIKFIRPIKILGVNYVLVGIRRSVYVVQAGSPSTVIRRVVFPAPVLSADDLVEHILVTLSGEELGNDDPKMYLMAREAAAGFSAECFGEGTVTVFNGIQSVQSVDVLDNTWVMVGRFADGSRVLTAESTWEFLFETLPREIYRSTYPLEAAYVDARVVRVVGAAVYKDRYFAVLSPQEKVLLLIKEYPEFSSGSYRTRSATYTFDLSAFGTPSSLRIDRDNEQLAFLDKSGRSARLVILNYQLGASPTIQTASPLTQDLGEITPGGLARGTRPDGSVEWVINGAGAEVLRRGNTLLSEDGPRAP